MKRCQAHISSRGDAEAGLLKPPQIFFNQFPVQIIQRKFFRFYLFLFGTEFEEYTKSISVRHDSIGTKPNGTRQILGKKISQVISKISRFHLPSPPEIYRRRSWRPSLSVQGKPRQSV